MKESKLKELLKSALPEGATLPEGIDFKKIGETVNTFANDLVAKNKPDLEKVKEDAKKSAANDLVAGLGIKNVDNLDGLKSHIETLGKNSTEHTKTIDQLSKELETKTAEYEKVNNDFTEINEKYTGVTRKSAVQSLGVLEKHQNDFITLASAKVTDDLSFDDAAKEVALSNSSWLDDKGRESIGAGTGGRTKTEAQALDDARKVLKI